MLLLSPAHCMLTKTKHSIQKRIKFKLYLNLGTTETWKALWKEILFITVLQLYQYFCLC